MKARRIRALHRNLPTKRIAHLRLKKAEASHIACHRRFVTDSRQRSPWRGKGAAAGSILGSWAERQPFCRFAVIEVSASWCETRSEEIRLTASQSETSFYATLAGTERSGIGSCGATWRLGRRRFIGDKTSAGARGSGAGRKSASHRIASHRSPFCPVSM